MKDYRTRYTQDIPDIEEEKEEACPCPCDNETPVKSLAHDASLDSLNQEFEEEVVEIDCGVVDTKANKDI